ncbi:MAG: hypothetical protein WDN00_00780 [Limisphaerales bacterium]
MCSELGLEKGSGYIKYVEPITAASFGWAHTAGALSALAGNNGTNWKAELPDEQKARDLFGAHGLQMGELSLHQFKNGIRPKQSLQLLNYLALRLRKGARSWERDCASSLSLDRGLCRFCDRAG